MTDSTSRYLASCSTMTFGESPPISSEISAMSDMPAGTQLNRQVAHENPLMRCSRAPTPKLIRRQLTRMSVTGSASVGKRWISAMVM